MIYAPSAQKLWFVDNSFLCRSVQSKKGKWSPIGKGMNQTTNRKFERTVLVHWVMDCSFANHPFNEPPMNWPDSSAFWAHIQDLLQLLGERAKGIVLSQWKLTSPTNQELFRELKFIGGLWFWFMGLHEPRTTIFKLLHITCLFLSPILYLSQWSSWEGRLNMNWRNRMQEKGLKKKPCMVPLGIPFPLAGAFAFRTRYRSS